MLLHTLLHYIFFSPYNAFTLEGMCAFTLSPFSFGRGHS